MKNITIQKSNGDIPLWLRQRVLGEILEQVDVVAQSSTRGRPAADSDYAPKITKKVRLSSGALSWLQSLGPRELSRINAIIETLARLDPNFDAGSDEYGDDFKVITEKQHGNDNRV